MVQCPDCESKDRITIAGRVFCASCGTPWVGSDSTKKADKAAEELPKLDQKPPETAPPAPVVASDTKPSVLATPDNPETPDVEEKPIPLDPAKILADAKPVPAEKPKIAPLARPIIPSSPLDTLAKAQSAPVAQPSQAPPTAPSVGADAPKLTIHRPSPMAAPIEQPSDMIKKFHGGEQPVVAAQVAPVAVAPASTPTPAPVPAPVPEASPPAQIPAATVAPPAPAQNQVSAPVVAPAPLTPLAPIAASADLKNQAVSTVTKGENSDIEISSLDNKAQAVLSDQQFTDLSKIDTSKEAPVNPNEDAVATVPGPAVTDTVAPAPTSSVASPTATAAIAASEPAAPSVATRVVTPSPSIAAAAAAMSQAPAEGAAIAVPTSVATNNDSSVIIPPALLTQTPAATAPAAAPNTASPDAIPTELPVKRLQDVVTPPPALAIKTDATPKMDGVSMSKEQALELALGGGAGDADKASRAGLGALKVAAAVVLVLIFGGYVWQVNYPNLAVKVGAARAGISANLPNYLPNGWTVSKSIVSETGKLSYNATNSNGAKIVITQTKTDWDSAALRENFVATQTGQYTSILVQGLNVYIYGDNQATWVNRGSWFKVDGAGTGLTQDQLIKISTSL